MRNLNVSAMDTRDSQGRARFNLFHPEKQINLKNDSTQQEFLKSEYYPYQPVTLFKRFCYNKYLQFYVLKTGT